MKVLQVGDIAGVGFKLNTALNARQGIEAHILVCAGGDRFYPGQEADTVRQIPCRSRLSNLRLYKSLLGARREYDVYHGHSLMAPMLLASCRPFVAHFHGSDIRQVAGSQTPMGMALRRAMRSAGHVIHSTVELGPMIQALGVDEDRLSWLPNPIDTVRFTPGRCEVDLRQGSEFVVFLPQPLVEVRRSHLLFEAFCRVATRRPEIRLSWIAHPGTIARNHQMQDLLEKAGVAHQATRLDPIPPVAMVDHYRAADAVADWFNADLPAISQTAMEAMACERPVIMSLPADPSDYLNSSGALPGNSSELIEASLERLVDDPPLRVQMGRTHREWVCNHHDMTRVGQQLAAIYESLKETSH